MTEDQARIEQLERMAAAVDAASLPGGARAAEWSLPPSANRGVETVGGRGALLGVGVDFLTASMPAADVPGSPALHLCDWTPLQEAGKGRRMFGASERRLCLGGEAWRMMQPGQPSKAWGLAFESWEFASGGASWAADFLRRVTPGQVRPSRVDIAFDFEVGEGVTADDWASSVSQHVQRRRLAQGIAGQDGVNTRYIGSAQSERRIRCYRKDLQSAVLGAMLGPVLRVEVVLRAEHAQAWWAVWERDPEEAYRAAAGHVLDMTGCQLLDEVGPVPELVLPDGKDEAQQLTLFLEQHGDMLAALDESGVDVLGMARERMGTAGKVRRHRFRRRVEAMGRVGVVQVVAICRHALGLERPQEVAERMGGPGGGARRPEAAGAA